MSWVRFCLLYRVLSWRSRGSNGSNRSLRSFVARSSGPTWRPRGSSGARRTRWARGARTSLSSSSGQNSSLCFHLCVSVEELMRAVRGDRWHQQAPGVPHLPPPQEHPGGLEVPSVLGGQLAPEGSCPIVFGDGKQWYYR